MLSAEHMALQSRLVSNLAAVRQREMDYILSRFQAIGTQAALLGGFALGSFTSFAGSLTSENSEWAIHFFSAASYVCIVANVGVVVLTLYVCNWAPRLALCGPTGSMARAFDAVRGERVIVNYFFLSGLLSFIVQSILVGVLLEESSPDQGGPLGRDIIIASIFVAIICVGIGLYVKRMHERFFFTNEPVVDRAPVDPGNNGPRRSSFVGQATSANARSAASTTNDGRLPLLDNPVTIVQDHPDVDRNTQGVDVQPLGNVSNDFELTGTLSKKNSTEDGGSLMRQLSGSINRTVANEWRARFFVLRMGKLQYWTSEQSYQAGKEGSLEEPIDVSVGYHVLVDTSDPNWGFVLQPTTADGRRTWYLRAPTEVDRLEWTRRLVITTMQGR